MCLLNLQLATTYIIIHSEAQRESTSDKKINSYRWHQKRKWTATACERALYCGETEAGSGCFGSNWSWAGAVFPSRLKQTVAWHLAEVEEDFFTVSWCQEHPSVIGQYFNNTHETLTGLHTWRSCQERSLDSLKMSFLTGFVSGVIINIKHLKKIWILPCTEMA